MVARRFQRRIMRWLTKAVAEGAEANYDRERSLLPERRIEKIRVYGNPIFTAQVTEALARLKQDYPYGYSLVQRYLRAVVESKTDPSRGETDGVVYSESGADGGLRVAANRFAAFLVRRAVATRKRLGFQIWRSPASALKSLERELHAMRLLQCESKYFHQQQNKILKFERQLRNELPKHRLSLKTI
jgi:hypothetical protein